MTYQRVVKSPGALNVSEANLQGSDKIALANSGPISAQVSLNALADFIAPVPDSPAALFITYNLAFWGDSLIYGRGGEDPDGRFIPFQSQMPQYLGYRNIYNGGISGQTSAEILARVQASTDMRTWTNFFEGGLNDLTDMGPTQAWLDQLLANFADMVATLGDNENYYVIGLVNSGREWAASTYGQLYIDRYNIILEANEQLAAIYGDRFIDIRTWLVNDALSALGETPTAQDLTDIANDIPPTSLRRDSLNVHYNDLGLQAWAYRISSIIAANEPDGGDVVTYNGLVEALGAGAIATQLYVNALESYYLGDTSQGGGRFITANPDLRNTYIGFGTGEPADTASPSLDITMVGDHAGNGSAGRGNTGIGSTVLAALTTGTFNTGLGGNAMAAVQDGAGNTALGYDTLKSLVSGEGFTAVGRYALQSTTSTTPSTAIGWQAMLSTTTGSGTAVGYQALRNNTTGNGNVAVGRLALFGNTSAGNNTAVGVLALTANTTGASNTAIGSNALAATLTTTGHTAVGFEALFATTSATPATAVGYQAMLSTTTGSGTAVGYQALRNNTTGTGLVAVGRLALMSNTTAINNVAVGSSSLTANTTGANNIAIGSAAMASNDSGDTNVAIGTSAMNATITSSQNVAIGYQVLLLSTDTGGHNTVIGYQGMKSSLTGANNTVVGNSALFTGTAVQRTVAIGRSALNLATGDNNIALGYQAGDGLTSGTKNIIIGYDIDAQNAAGDNQLTIGNLIIGTGVDGSGTTLSTGHIGLGMVPASDVRLDVDGAVRSNAGFYGVEVAAPSAPGSNGYRLFAQDNGAGKTQLMVLFSSGAAQQIAIQP